MSNRTEKLGIVEWLLLLLLITAPFARAQMDRTQLADASNRKAMPKIAAPALPPPSARSSSVSLSPAVVMAKGNFGQSITQTLVLTNDTPMPMSFELVAEDVVVRDGKRVFVPAGQMQGSIAATAVFSAKTIAIAPWSTGGVDVHFTVPANTPVRAVVALFRGTNTLPSTRQGIAMTASLGTLITFTLSDNFRVAAEPIRVDSSDAATVTILQPLTNTGTEPVMPEGMVAILEPGGTLVMKAPITAQRLLPGEHLDFQAQCASAMLSPGTYRVLASYQFEGRTMTESSELKLK